MPEVTQVLVVDDSPIDRKLAGRILEKQPNLAVSYAQNGEEALACLAEGGAHIVVTDLLMPGIDGLELVSEARERYPFVPVVLMTAHGSEETAVRALTAGAASYVPKRRLAEELADTVAAVLAVARGERDEQRAYQMLEGGELVHTLGADVTDLTALVRHLESLVRHLGDWDRAEAVQIGVAIREALINAVDHGNLELDSTLKDQGRYDEVRAKRVKRSPYRERRVSIRTQISAEELVWTVADEGGGFVPEDVPDPTDPMNLDRIYGRGLLLIRTFMDEVSHSDTGSQITMTKRRKA